MPASCLTSDFPGGSQCPSRGWHSTTVLCCCILHVMLLSLIIILRWAPLHLPAEAPKASLTLPESRNRESDTAGPPALGGCSFPLTPVCRSPHTQSLH